VKADLYTVVPVVSDNVIFNNGFCRAVQVNSVVEVIFINVAAVQPAAVLVINAIFIELKMIIQDLDDPTRLDPVISVLDGEADDPRVGCRFVYGNDPVCCSSTVYDRLVDESFLAGGVEV